MANQPKLQHRSLGKGGLTVSAIGLGCMSLSGIYGAADDAVSEDLIRHAIDRGVDHFDSSDMYGWGHNERVLGHALKGRRDQVVLATKFGQVERPGQSNGVNGRPEYVIEACEASLKRLGVDVIDLYYQHRADPVGAGGGDGGRDGEAGGAGQGSLPRPVRGRARTASAAPTPCIRSPRCRPNTPCCTGRRRRKPARPPSNSGIGFVAYSPLGRGFLTGALKSLADIDGRRAAHPRFQEANFDRNRALVAKIEEIAAEKGCTPVPGDAGMAAGARAGCGGDPRHPPCEPPGREHRRA